MSETRTIAMIGLPRTGKSTFIGTLWLLVQDDLVTELEEEDFKGDRAHVNMLATHVANGDEIQRTAVDTDDGFEIEVGFRNGDSVRLHIPDLSGEASRELVEERLWRKSLAETLLSADALMLFVHPEKIEPPVPAGFGQEEGDGGDDVLEAAAAAEPGLPERQQQNAGDSRAKPSGDSGEHDDRDTGDGSTSNSKGFSPRKACSAAKLIELLENVIEIRPDLWPIPVAVVVSAWDRIDHEPRPTPGEWLEKRLPGVNGVLSCNPDQVRAAVFGVSAQGGKLPNQKEELLAKGEVRERVYAVDPDGNPTGIWAPLRWVLGLDE